jgi:hypothetical protein
MIIDTIYQLVQYIANKEQRGDIPPGKFNLLVKTAQLQFISKRLGNAQITPGGVPTSGYQSSWIVNEDLRPFVYGPIEIPISNKGNFEYPYGYIWPDAWHKNDFAPITRINADQYPFIKRSHLIPPDEDYPYIIFRNPYGFIDPYSIGSFQMSYLKYPPDPIWGYTLVNDVPIFNTSTSVDVFVDPLSYLELTLMILQNVGVNLSSDLVTQYAVAKEKDNI